MKKIMSLLLVLTMVLSLFAGCGGEGGTAVVQPAQQIPTETRPDGEYERAVWYGFVPESLREADPDQTVVTWVQYCNMLGSMIKLHDEENYRVWEKMVQGATDAEMKRDGAMVSLLFAAKTMGYASFNAPNPAAFDAYAPKVWEVVTMDYPVFDWDTPVDLGDGCSDNNHVGPAYDFSVRRVSVESGKSLLEFDETGDLCLEQPLTLREAAFSVIRLYESEVYTEPKAMTLETMDEELLRAYDFGLLPEEWLADMNKTVTVGEFNRQLTKIVEMRSSALVPEWERVAEQALVFEETAQRDDAVLSIYEAAVIMGIHNTGRSPVEEDWEEKSTAEDWWEGRTMDYDYFPNWGELSADASGVFYAQTHVSLVSQKPLFMPTEKWTMGLGMNVTREDAARALVRFVESDPSITYGESKYICVTDVGTYDTNIITQELLNKETNLPEVSQSELPSEWKGAGLSARKSFDDQYLPFEETDVRILAENGFNFARLFFGFGTLRYPDFPEDPRSINEMELKELDQLLAWCMEYGVHLQIAMSFYLDENGEAIDVVPRTEEEWALVTDFWEAIARRYAGIPSKYLTFDLSNEIVPNGEQDVAFAERGYTAMVNAIRRADAERVLLQSFSGYANEAWAEVLGKLNIAIGCHPYRPHAYCDGTYPDSPFMESNLYWPRPRFNSTVCYGEAVTITGEGLTGTLTVYPNGCDPDALLWVFADGKRIAEIDLPGAAVRNEYGGYEFHNNEAFSVEIPEGTKQISLQPAGNAMYLNAVGIENDSFHTYLMCHNAYEHMSDGANSTALTIDGAGNWQNAEGLMSDAEYVYERHIVPLIEIAEKYNVGFMVNEFGLFGVKVYWDIDKVVQYHDEYLKMLENHEIGWCYCELFNIFPKHLVILYGTESQWTGSTTEPVTYTYEDGAEDTVYICKDLMDTFRKYTLK